MRAKWIGVALTALMACAGAAGRWCCNRFGLFRTGATSEG